MLRTSAKMNHLVWSHVGEVEWICFIKQNVQVPTSGLGIFEILGVRCHKFVDMLQFSAQMNPLPYSYSSTHFWDKDFWNSGFWRPQVCSNHENVTMNESSRIVFCHRWYNFLTQAKCSSTHLVKSLVLEVQDTVCWNVENSSSVRAKLNVQDLEYPWFWRPQVSMFKWWEY